MNGVALLDMVREGGMREPVRYLEHYFAHSPVLSMPYHPPLFPAMEAMFLAVFGVHTASSRLAVATTVFAAVLLLIRVLVQAGLSATVAFAATLTFFSLKITQRLSAEVMLEMPALMFALAALLFLRGFQEDGSAGRALLAGVFAAAAVWTKQTSFLAMVPVLTIVFARSWRPIRGRSFWVFEALTIGAVLALSFLWRLAGIPWHPLNWAKIGYVGLLVRNVGFYASTIYSHYGTPLILFFILAALVVLSRPLQPQASRLMKCVDPICRGWLCSALLLVMIVPAIELRYLIYAFPVAIALMYGMMEAFLLSWMRSGWVKIVLSACGAAVFLVNLPLQPLVLSGPAEVATRYMQWERAGYSCVRLWMEVSCSRCAEWIRVMPQPFYAPTNSIGGSTSRPPSRVLRLRTG
jgi:4-amino-4-deoxy-L-arabinose transferase-like glycosyltransferase